MVKHLEGLINAGRFDDAERYITEMVINSSVPASAFYSICKLYISRKIWDIPAPLVGRLIGIAKDNVELFIDMADRLYLKGEHSKAVRMLKTCIEFDEHNGTLWNKIGRGYFQLGEIDNSEQCFKKALALQPESREAIENLQLAQTKKYLLSFFKGNEYGEYYIDMHFNRFVETLKILPKGHKGEKLLELGSYPYLALLYKKYLKYDLYLNCFFKDEDKIHGMSVSNESGETHDFSFYNFDVEKDVFPFEDGMFDVVVAFELIEHMEEDPMFMINEANRVLKKGGKLIITTPNIASLRSLHFVLHGIAPYYYPKFGVPVGSSRHFREFTPWELKVLFEAGGFNVNMLETKNVWQRNPEGFDYGTIYDQYRLLLKQCEEKNYGHITRVPAELRGEDIFIIGEKTGAVKDRYPEMLYQNT